MTTSEIRLVSIHAAETNTNYLLLLMHKEESIHIHISKLMVYQSLGQPALV